MMTAKEFLEKRGSLKNKKKNKFRALKCEYNGKKFPSKLERDVYIALEMLKQEKKIDFFVRQLPFDLPGGYIHKVDFAAVTNKGNIYIEAKGRDLPMGKLKREQVCDLYKIEIHVITKPEQIRELF